MHRYLSQLLVNTSVTILVRCWLLVKSRSIYHWPSSILPSVKYRSSVTQQIDQQSVMIASVVCWECVSGISVNNQHHLYNFFTNLISKAFLYKVTRYLSSNMRWTVLIVTQLTAYFHLRENVLDIMCLTDSLD